MFCSFLICFVVINALGSVPSARGRLSAVESSKAALSSLLQVADSSDQTSTGEAAAKGKKIQIFNLLYFPYSQHK